MVRLSARPPRFLPRGLLRCDSSSLSHAVAERPAPGGGLPPRNFFLFFFPCGGGLPPRIGMSQGSCCYLMACALGCALMFEQAAWPPRAFVSGAFRPRYRF